MMLNDDYKEMLQELSDGNVKFLLVGAYALAVHGYVRATLDLDVWVMPSRENSEAVLQALSRFGAALHGLTTGDLQKEDMVFQIGVAPRRIDIMTSVSGLDFEESFRNSISVDIEGIRVKIPLISDLIRNKRAAGRMKDLADAEALEALNGERK